MAEPTNPFCELLARFQAGDQEAGNEMIRRFGVEIPYIIKHRLEKWGCLRPVCDVDDVIQDALKSLVRRATDISLEEIDTDAKLLAFLKKIAEHKVNRAIRMYVNTSKRDVRRQAAIDASAENLPAPTLSPPEILAGIEKQAALRRVRAELTALEKKILRMRKLGYNMAKIAALLQRTEEEVLQIFFQIVKRVEPFL